MGLYTGREPPILILAGGTPRLSEVKVPYSSSGFSLSSACGKTKPRTSSPA